MAKIDPSNFKDRYVELPLDDGTKVVVKLEDEGVVIDRWNRAGDEVIDTTWKSYQEMEDGE